MTEQPSPWARPPAGSQDPAGGSAYPPAVDPVPPRTGGVTAAPPRTGGVAATNVAPRANPTGYRAGAVTRLGPTPTPTPAALPLGPAAPPPDPARRNRLMLRWFGVVAIGVVAAGVAVVLVMVTTGGGSPFGRRLAGPSDTRPDLAKLCPPPPQDAGSGAPAPPPPPGPRTVDGVSGISYQAFGAPWLPWHDVWTKGTLHVSYQTGQYFVTESYSDRDGLRNEYLASILSGSVPAADNDALSLDLQCTGRQVAADVRAEYYPQPNRMDLLRDEQTTLGGRPAWVTTFRMHFHRAGLKAGDELVGLALVDVGRPRAAILYVSIPGTHRDYDWVVDTVLNSVRPVG
jgi:hypothetical protein